VARGGLMILDDDGETSGRAARHGATLDSLFRRVGVRRAHGLALIDPPDRYRVSDGGPRSLTFADADRAVSSVASQLRDRGLPTDALVAIQLGNTVESAIALLAVLRAGMIAVPLPLLWRKHEIVAALTQVGAKAIITASHVGDVRTAQIAVEAAAELFTVRHVCGFGRSLPDGVVPLDLRAAGSISQPPARAGHPAAHVAVVTFDVTPNGPVAVARNHTELIAGGLAVALEAGHPQDGAILSAVPMTSFAGLALTLVPWLLAGGALHLHHPFEPETFAAQRKAVGAGLVVLPGATLPALGTAERSAGETIAALWRAPERLAAQAAWHGPAALVDVTAIGEFGLVAAQRKPGAGPAGLPYGTVGAPHAVAKDGTPLIEVLRTADGTVGLRGAMVPTHAFPPGAAQGYAPFLAPDRAGLVDTGLACRRKLDTNTLTVSAPPAGLVTVGGYRFYKSALEEAVAAIDLDATIVALPDAILGERLAGSTRDAAAIIAAMQAAGATPLIANAFRPRAAG
ncbi:MAG: class I adenylate-forming enzyme family protein, partial [Pseudolabrys sp.]